MKTLKSLLAVVLGLTGFSSAMAVDVPASLIVNAGGNGVGMGLTLRSRGPVLRR